VNIVKPGSTIGIIGGGQLGRMMALSAKAMGYRIAVLDPTPDAPCGQVADQVITAPYDDYEACKQLALMSDVLTYEFENIDEHAAAQLSEMSDFPQGYEVLATTQHRLKEKQALEQLSIPVAPFAPISKLADIANAIVVTGLPAILKTCRGGYDGKGQAVVKTTEDVEASCKALLNHGELVLERLIPFECEISVLATKSRHGDVEIFPVAENEHKESVLHRTIVPARIDTSIEEEAKRIALRIVEGLNVVGTLAVEMFVTKEGTILVNELAPRPHNSGHYTIEACKVSQFEQHIRAVCGLPLRKPTLLSPCVMENVLGEQVSPLMERLDELQQVSLHLYGKKEAKEKRKMGHLTVLEQDTATCIQALDAFWEKKTKVLEEME